MASFEQDNIMFSNVTTGISKPGKFYNGNNGNFSNTDIDGVESFINAVEIDWNGASLGNEITDSATLTTGEQILINTTGQLLSYMSVISQKITNLENILMNL